MNLPLYERMTRWSSLFYDDLELLLSPSLMSELPATDRLRYIDRERGQMEQLSTLGKLLHANYKTYLLDDLLVKTDRCTMANSLEARSPFLDTALVEYAATIPDALKLRRGRTKIILRDAFADLLPKKIITRGKMGFGVPFGTWFRTDLREYLSDLLLVGRPLCADYLSLDYVRQLVTRHLNGQADLGLQLWSILCFERWLRILPDWYRNPTVAVNGGSVIR
jgi:asparagine synthase (glutamine-hydrolysing)